MTEAYEYQPYPKWLFHPNGATCLVQSAAEHKAKGPKWGEAPAVSVKPVEPAEETR